MKKYLFAVLIGCCSLLLTSCETDTEQIGLIENNKVYFFTQRTCPHCHAATAYIKKNYPQVKIQELEISNAKNLEKFYACGSKFSISKWNLGTPLFCMGSHHILGWSEESQREFDEYIKEFIPQK